MNTSSASYNVKVQFKKGEILQFPDFQWVYRGQRRIELPIRKDAFAVLEDFEAIQGNHHVQVTYHHGYPGEIGPKEFTINGRSFILEMQSTISVDAPLSSWLKADELLLWRKEDFEKTLKKVLASMPKRQ